VAEHESKNLLRILVIDEKQVFEDPGISPVINRKHLTYLALPCLRVARVTYAGFISAWNCAEPDAERTNGNHGQVHRFAGVPNRTTWKEIGTRGIPPPDFTTSVSLSSSTYG
jgi:hypothetical protein